MSNDSTQNMPTAICGCKKELKETFLKECKQTLFEFYGESPISSPHLAKIINEYHFNRLNNLLNNASAVSKVGGSPGLKIL